MKSPLLQFIGCAAVAAIAAFSVAACHDDAPKPSTQVGTDQTYVFFSVTARSSGPVYADAQLREGGAGGAPLQLAGGDSLWFSAGQPVNAFEASGNIADALADAADRIARMDEQGTFEFDFLFLEFAILGTPYYTGTLNPVPENRYYLGYLREQLSNATESYVSLPPAFQIIAPLSNETVSRTNDIVVNWETSAESIDEVEIHASLVCEGVIRQSFNNRLTSDTGTYTVPGGTLDVVTNQTCPLDIEITKRRFGTLGANLNGGDINGQRVTTVTVMSTD